MGIACTYDDHKSVESYLASNEGKNLPVPHCIRGSKGAELVEEVKAMSEYFIIPPFAKGAFGSIEFADKIKEFGVEEIEMTGVCPDICVISNAMIERG